MAKIYKAIIDFNSKEVHTYYTEQATAPSGIKSIEGYTLFRDGEGHLSGDWGNEDLALALEDFLGTQCEVVDPPHLVLAESSTEEPIEAPIEDK